MAKEGEGMVADTEILNEEVLDGKVDMGADAETASDSSTDKTAGKDKTGEVEKTQVGGEGAETKPDDEVKEGQPIPYPRFKQVNDKLKTMEAELGEARGFFKHPDVFRAMLIARGVTDKKVQDDKLKEAGFEVKAPPTPDDDVFKQITEGVDLNTKEGWFKSFKKAFDLWGKDLVSPIQKKLSDRERNERNTQSESDARKLAKETFNLEYGEAGKSEDNPNTAIGKMWAYLNKHPDHAAFGHSAVLRLALSEEGFQLGKQEGKKEELTRNDALKRSAMETGEETVREGEPNGDWSVTDLMNYARTHGK
jgi:hypothetical protein